MGGSGGGSGSSGGGGGSSGQIDYPGYMKDRHAPLFDRMVSKMEAAVSSNPYRSMSVFDPQPFMILMGKVVDEFETKVNGFNPTSSWKGHFTDVTKMLAEFVENPYVDDLIKEQQRKSEEDFRHEVLPKFRAGMRDNGAVMTSAYKIGEALLYSQHLREKTGFEKDFRGKIMGTMLTQAPQLADMLVKYEMQKLEYDKVLMHYWMEHQRMTIAGMQDRDSIIREIDVMKVTWPLEMEKYVMDALGAISGSAGASSSGGSAGRQGSRTGSAIGGALSGAASGAMMGSAGGPWGAAIGGVVGGALGLFGGLSG